VIRLTNPVSGHEARTDEQSVGFWLAAGYVRKEPVKAPAKPAPKRRASKKSTTK